MTLSIITITYNNYEELIATCNSLKKISTKFEHVIINGGNCDLSFDFLESFLPVQEGETKIIDKSFNLNDLLPVNNRSFYHYHGSLTTPPCSEDVNWILFKKPVILSVEQVKLLKELMPLNNYRNEQPLNDRVVWKNFQ